MVHVVVQLALTLAGAYLSFYVANGPCEFSGKPPLGPAWFHASLVCCPHALIMPTDSFAHHGICLMTLPSHVRQALED